MGTAEFIFPHRHLLGIEGLSRPDIEGLLALAEEEVLISLQVEKKKSSLRGRTQINLFFENSTRTQASFELAGKRLGADVMNMSVANSSVKKGETLIDTAMTLNAMRPDIIIVRHHAAGAVHLLARKVDCAVVNAGDGAHEHPTQALLDALTIRRNKGRIEGLTVAICGDIMHSRVARSNIYGLTTMGAKVVLCAPPTLIPPRMDEMGCTIAPTIEDACENADVVMGLRIQRERQQKGLFPSVAEYCDHWEITPQRLALAKKNALVMHPGPMNRGVEIASSVADCGQSVITQQVESGVAVRMALLYMLTRRENA